MGARDAKYLTGLAGLLCLTLATAAAGGGADRYVAYLLFVGLLLLGTSAGLFWLERDMERHLAARRAAVPEVGRRT
ncbi:MULTISPECIES: hypothetical protein [unclassified Streptomyces]|uniref:hypothetical protein n=1 Tax=unclassified Streptomyces TaxID=2593676 RepID=UPI0022511995|nr:hypothetical protein [Streptomyces sp. NBC_01264]MCX4784119.1 hypothetical protein [Streptomyces sp. NBC_01264]